jgi:amino acid permease
MNIDNPNYDANTNQNDLSASISLLNYVNGYQPKKINPIYNERQVEINKYYSMKYKSESYILKLIIFFCGLALVGCLFKLKGFIGNVLYIIYLGFIINIGIIVICYNIYKLFYKDNQKYDENDYGHMNLQGNNSDLSDNYIKTDKTNNSNSDKNKCI